MKPTNATIELFTYGTLQPGEFFYHRIADDVLSMRQARVTGQLFLALDGSFPILDATADGTVVGTTLELLLTTDVLDIFHMELRTGYTAVEVDELDADLLPTGHRVIAFHYPATSDLTMVGPRIEHGDWIAHTGSA